MWSGGKIGGKIALKPGDFGIQDFVEIRYFFSGFGD
jgi:hypothetical protein